MVEKSEVLEDVEISKQKIQVSDVKADSISGGVEVEVLLKEI